MVTLIAFVLTISILIAVHEYGHFQMARWCGVKVLRFSIGFGKPLFIRQFGGDRTEFVFAALPLGGYVKMLDEREAPVEDAHDLPRAFNRQSVWRRIAIVTAGPMANLLLAIVLYWLLFMLGVPGMKPLLGEISQDSPAAYANMKSGELIKKIAGIPVTTWQDVRWVLLQQSFKTTEVEIEATDENSEVHLHQLDLSGVDKDNFEDDFLSGLGLKSYQPEVPARIGEVIKGGAAAHAGLETADEILLVNDIAVKQWEEFVTVIRKNPGQLLDLKIKRKDAVMIVTVTPDAVVESGQRIGRIGATYHVEQAEIDKLLINVQYPPFVALAKATEKTWDSSVFTLKMLGNMLTGDVSWKGVSGPITIASYAGQTAHIGLTAFISFLAIISISLGVLNLLPIPVLDGGHLLYYMVEILKGSPVSDAVMEIGQRAGFALLGLLMVVAFYNDFNRLITG